MDIEVYGWETAVPYTLKVECKGLATRIVTVTATSYTVRYCDYPLTHSHATCDKPDTVPFENDIHWLADHIRQWRANGATITRLEN